MMVNPTTLSLRAKKLGALITDARHAARKNLEDCAEAIGVPATTLESFELGQSSPSLPQLELLAYYLDVPLDHFWGKQSISEDPNLDRRLDTERLIGLRNRMVGANLRMARTQAGIPLDELAQQTGLPIAQLEAYELGQVPVPLPTLEALADVLHVPLKDYFDKKGPIGHWSNQRQMVQNFLQLPPELQAFVAKPVNQPYIELAQRLSNMSVDKLRAVAEVLLEITY